MKMFIIYTLMLLGCSANNTAIEKDNKVSGKVIKIIDGDTFDILTENQISIRIRMNGIDCPERKQDYYRVCKNALARYIFGKNVQLITHGIDRYRRTIADVFYNNKNINVAMIKNGFAWHFKKYSSDNEMAKAEQNAREAKIGLWQMDSPTPPWDLRHSKKH
jgi:endonuclease YncB( thermonuclease family)